MVSTAAPQRLSNSQVWLRKGPLNWTEQILQGSGFKDTVCSANPLTPGLLQQQPPADCSTVIGHSQSAVCTVLQQYMPVHDPVAALP
jgi:hypothetical protein